jgi:REP element-mobilizing transposase RayT
MSGDRYYIRDQNALYFITPTIVNWLDVFIRQEYKYVIVDSLNYCVDKKGLNIYAWCLMTSHMHLVASARESFSMSDILRDFKKFTANKIIGMIKEIPESRRAFLLNQFEEEGLSDKRITKYKFWQESNHAVELDPFKPEIIDQKINYIHYNPVEAGIVSNPVDYLFSSARDYADMKGLVKVIIA